MRVDTRVHGPLLSAFLCALLIIPAQAETLRGRIFERASLAAAPAGKGVAAARLVLYASDGKKRAAKTAGRNGAYAFPGLLPGSYTLAVSRAGYLPKPLVRSIVVGEGDTLTRDFALDRLPSRGGVPVQGMAPTRSKAKAHAKTPALPYYPQLAAGMLASLGSPACYRDSAIGNASFGRFYDAEDTTLAYRSLWASMLWADVEGQGRPTAAHVYLAHAYDSVLRAAGLPAPTSLKPWLKADADSTEAEALLAYRMLAKPSKRDEIADLAKRALPKSIALAILEETFSAPAPKPKKKAFLAKIKGMIGPEAARRIALSIDPPRKPRTKMPPPPPPAWEGDALWKVMTEAADGRAPNPVALYHLAIRKAEAGKAREALGDLEQVAALRPDDARVTAARAGASLAAGDTTAAAGLYDSLSRVESPEWQARGFRATARLAWRGGRGEDAEKALWRALGLEGRSADGRGDLMLLARLSLARGTWKPVEALLDSLLKLRPREADAHYWLGEMALKREQDGVALEHFQQASRLAPKRVEFAEAVAAAYFAREECDPALKALQPVRAKLGAEGLAVFGSCLLAQGRAGAAVTEFGKLYAGKPSGANLAAYARALTASKRADQAVSAIDGSPYAGDFGVRKAWAEAYLALDQPDKAKGLLDPPPAGQESDAEAHYLLGRAEYAARDYAAAGKWLTAALQYRADYPEAKYLQGLCLLKQGRSGEAHFYFTELMDSEKPSWRAKGLLGQGQAFAREEKSEAAEENLRRSFQAAPGAEAAAHLALVLLKLDKNQEAEEWAAKARKLDPDEPLGLMAAVDGLLAGHREADAVALAQAGLDAHPASCDFMVVAAKAHLRAGHDTQAGDLSRRATARCPEESAPYFFLGTLSARAGTVPEARRLFAEYIRTGGDAKRVPAGYR